MLRPHINHIKWAIVASSILCIAYLLYQKTVPLLSDGASSKVDAKLLSASDREAVNASGAASGISYSAAITQSSVVAGSYQPRVPRGVRQFLGPINADGSVSKSVPNWWLYARSQADADWLDRNGYPTPAEELALSRKADAELSDLASRGDLNAKAHLLARSIGKILQFNSMKEVNEVGAEVRGMLRDGGPYQAQKAFQAYSELLTKFSKLSETDQMIELQKIGALFHEAQFALNLGTMIGDLVISPEEKKLILAIQKEHFSSKEMEITAATLAGRLGDMARERTRKGLPPIELLPRPFFIGTEAPFGSNIVLERF